MYSVNFADLKRKMGYMSTLSEKPNEEEFFFSKEHSNCSALWEYTLIETKKANMHL